ncbi:phosphopantetheine-binding protein [uncultured Dysgonomonas sp.]|uniref:phosphopantetheine-binding protein n=1 Tax=Dysgonomonas mossii TaxID=163665 RepID=UPI002803E239|nr:phosphopantetheine-binding protein [uncultured Dysgonomonas sp.]
MDTIIVKEERDLVFEVLHQFISDIIGADIAEELDITQNSNFTKDLEMDSIELVAFAEKVRVKYGTGIDFPKWLSAMDLDQIVKLNIGDIVNFIVDGNHSDK